jgi:hypothetical protein
MFSSIGMNTGEKYLIALASTKSQDLILDSEMRSKSIQAKKLESTSNLKIVWGILSNSADYLSAFFFLSPFISSHLNRAAIFKNSEVCSQYPSHFEKVGERSTWMYQNMERVIVKVHNIVIDLLDSFGITPFSEKIISEATSKTFPEILSERTEEFCKATLDSGSFLEKMSLRATNYLSILIENVKQFGSFMIQSNFGINVIVACSAGLSLYILYQIKFVNENKVFELRRDVAVALDEKFEKMLSDLRALRIEMRSNTFLREEVETLARGILENRERLEFELNSLNFPFLTQEVLENVLKPLLQEAKAILQRN